MVKRRKKARRRRSSAGLKGIKGIFGMDNIAMATGAGLNATIGAIVNNRFLGNRLRGNMVEVAGAASLYAIGNYVFKNKFVGNMAKGAMIATMAGFIEDNVAPMIIKAAAGAGASQAGGADVARTTPTGLLF